MHGARAFGLASKPESFFRRVVVRHLIAAVVGVTHHEGRQSRALSRRCGVRALLRRTVHPM